MEKPPEHISSLIIDDDPFIRDLLSDKLQQYFPEIQLKALGTSGEEGLSLIHLYQPDLIFLDVEMHDMTGFEMLSQITDRNFQTIFITSYSHYAIKAIRFNALDYLLKPIDLGELKAAIKRFKENRLKQVSQERLNMALSNYRTTDVSKHRLILQTQDGELNLQIQDIIRLEGERNYSFIFLKGGRKKLVSKTLADMEELLQGKGFFRVHRSFLVNGGHIQKILGRAQILLSDGVEIPISRRKKDSFELWYKDLVNSSKK